MKVMQVIVFKSSLVLIELLDLSKISSFMFISSHAWPYYMLVLNFLLLSNERTKIMFFI